RYVIEAAESILQCFQRAERRLSSFDVLMAWKNAAKELDHVAQFFRFDPKLVTGARIKFVQISSLLSDLLAKRGQNIGGMFLYWLLGARASLCPAPGFNPLGNIK